jgi:membrane associated rhomboid family serine protease
MEWNTLLLIAVVFSCGSLVYRWLGKRNAVRPGWVAVSVFVLVFTGAVALRWPHKAGLIGGVAWGILFALPMGLFNLSRRAKAAGNDRIATLLMGAVRVLHPTDGIPEEYAIARAGRRMEPGDDAGASNAHPTQAARPWATYILIGINFAVFGFELYKGAMKNDQILYGMGGLDLEAIKHHQWWRIFAANFLHFGWDHILMNMLGLWILGPFVEFALGWPRYIVLYLATGVGAMLIVLILQSRGLIEQAWVVGASGAIMGLIGANAAILLREWFRSRGPRIRRQLMNVVGIVVLQVLFDALSPHVSSSAHIGGVAVGFIIGSVLRYRRDKTYA